MPRWNSIIAPLVLLAAPALLGGCERPIQDAARIAAVKADADKILEANPLDAGIAEASWPPAIASLEPEFVQVGGDGIYITKRAYFDGGWGYFVPRTGQDLPEPNQRFEKLGEGIYWFHPY